MLTGTSDEETLVLVDIARAIDEVRKAGHGKVVIYVEKKHILRWEAVKSTSRRSYLKGLTSPQD